MQNKKVKSPFEPALNSSTLPPIFKLLFLNPVDAPIQVKLKGHLDQVWHRPPWLRPLFSLLARFNLLFPETGQHIASQMDIVGEYDRLNNPIQHWRRSFDFQHIRRHFNAMMIYHTD